jgi:hypothetical protein
MAEIRDEYTDEFCLVHAKFRADNFSGAFAKFFDLAEKFASSAARMGESSDRVAETMGGVVPSSDRLTSAIEKLTETFGKEGGESDAAARKTRRGLSEMASGGDKLSSLISKVAAAAGAFKLLQGAWRSLTPLFTAKFAVPDFGKEISKSFGVKFDTSQIAVLKDAAETFQRVAGGIKEALAGALMPLLARLTAWLKSADAAKFFDVLVKGINLAVGAVTWLIDAFGSVMAFLQPVFDWLAANVDEVVQGLVILGAVVAIVAAVMAAAWLIANWPVLLIIAAVAGLIGILSQLGLSTQQVCEFVGGVIGAVVAIVYDLVMGLAAFVWNLIADIWNLIAVFAEFFANVFNDPIGSIQRLFVGLFDFILGVVESCAGLIDTVFGSNLAGAVSGWRKSVADWAADNVGEAAITVQRMEKWTPERMKISDGIAKGMEMGAKFGETLENLDFGSFGTFKMGEPISSLDAEFCVNQAKFIVGSVGEIKKDVHIADEDLKLLEDMAERRYMQTVNTSTLSPNISVTVAGGADAERAGRNFA